MINLFIFDTRSDDAYAFSASSTLIPEVRMPTFPKTRGQRRAFNQLMALYRQGLSVRGCTSATRAADRIAVRALIAQHGCFAAVRETLQARQGGSEVTKP